MSRRCSSLWDRWACLTVGQMENVSVFDSLTSQVAMSNIWNNSGGQRSRETPLGFRIRRKHWENSGFLTIRPFGMTMHRVVLDDNA